MLDLVQQEETVARLGGIPFEQLIELLDSEHPAELQKTYARTSDLYMVLAGKGHRTPAESVELDRIDNSLRTVLGENGLAVFSAHLLRILDGARLGAQACLDESPDGDRLTRAWLTLGGSLAICKRSLSATPIPVDASGLARLLSSAAEAISALTDIQADSSWIHRWTGGEKAAERSVSQLLKSLARSNRPDSWLAAAALFDPGKTSPHQRIQRVRVCQRASGLAACLSILTEAGTAFRKTADVIREGLNP